MNIMLTSTQFYKMAKSNFLMPATNIISYHLAVNLDGPYVIAGQRDEISRRLMRMVLPIGTWSVYCYPTVYDVGPTVNQR